MAAATLIDETTWNTSDELLAARAVDGDEEAFALLFERWAPRVHRFARARLWSAEDADDVVQEVFINVLRCLPSYRGDSRFGTWLFGIAFHVVGRVLRRRARARTVPLGSADLDLAHLVAAPAGEARLDAARALERCADLLERHVTPSQRAVFELSELEGRSLGEVATRLGRDPKTVRAHLSRARRALRAALGTRAPVRERASG